MAIQRESGLLFESESIVLPKTIGVGIKVDEAAPTFPWHDIIGDVRPKTSGAGTPSYVAVQGNEFGYSFVANDIVDFVYHIPHDYFPGSDLFFHVHWQHNGTAISGNLVLEAYWTYAKGHNQANFPATKTGTVTYDTVNISTTPQYRHRIDEIQMSTAGGSATLLNTTDLEVDGLVKVRLKLITLPTITAGNLFIDTSDVHYQSTNVGTKGKAPSFY